MGRNRGASDRLAMLAIELAIDLSDETQKDEHTDRIHVLILLSESNSYTKKDKTYPIKLIFALVSASLRSTVKTN